MTQKTNYRFVILIAAPMVLTFIVLSITLGIYLNNFDGEILKDREAFGQFGDYIGGLLNPIIGLSTLILLAVSLHQAKTGILLLNEQITDTKNAANAQIEILQSEKDLNSAFALLNRNEEKMKQHADGTPGHAHHLYLAIFFEDYIERELESLMSRARSKRTGLTDPWQQFLSKNKSIGINELDTRIKYEENYVEFEIWGNSSVKGFWAEIVIEHWSVNSYAADQVLSRINFLHNQTQRDVIHSIIGSVDAPGLKLKPHQNIFYSLEELKQAQQTLKKSAS